MFGKFSGHNHDAGELVWRDGWTCGESALTHRDGRAFGNKRTCISLGDDTSRDSNACNPGKINGGAHAANAANALVGAMMIGISAGERTATPKLLVVVGDTAAFVTSVMCCLLALARYMTAAL